MVFQFWMVSGIPFRNGFTPRSFLQLRFSSRKLCCGRKNSLKGWCWPQNLPELEMQKKNSFISDDMLNQLRRHAINKADTHLIRTIYLRDWSGYIWVSREVEFYLLRAETPLRKWRLRCGFTDYKNSDYPDGHFYWQGEHPKIYKIYLYVTQKFEPQANILSEVWSW